MEPDDWKKSENNVFAFLDTIDLTDILDQCNGKNIWELCDEIEEAHPYKDEYSETLFDCVCSSDFIEYLQHTYGTNIVQEYTMTSIQSKSNEGKNISNPFRYQ